MLKFLQRLKIGFYNVCFSRNCCFKFSFSLIQRFIQHQKLIKIRSLTIKNIQKNKLSIKIIIKKIQ